MKFGYVYFVQADELRLIKIGVADRLETRLRNLAHGSPDRLMALGAKYVENAAGLEAALHIQFSEDRAHGEWFYPTTSLVDYIELKVGTPKAALERLNAILGFPTMPRGRPTKEMMRQREVAGLGKWL